MGGFKGLRTLVSAGFQTLAIQLLGVIFFYVVSLYLSKELFGVLSWCNAVVTTLNVVLSLGMEQVVLRRVAAGNRRSDWAAAAYFVHALASSLLMLLFLVLLSALLPGDTKVQFLPWLFAAQATIFVATPLKQFLNARERFVPYAVIATLANITKIVLVFLLIRDNTLELSEVAYVLLGCGLFEMLAAFAYNYFYASFRFRLRWLAYRKLVKEALPQFVFILFDSSLSRIDWILMGLMCADAVTGEYSFAYRAFEVARMPSLIQGMVLTPRVARLMQRNNQLDSIRNETLSRIFSLVMFGAFLMIVVLNGLWGPVVDWITDGKYGSVNTWVFFLLSLCIPMHLAINVWWSFAFSARKYREITRISIASSVVNLCANLVLIPLFQGVGAAVAFLLATLMQVVTFRRLAATLGVHQPLLPAGGMLLIFVGLFMSMYFVSLGVAAEVGILMAGFLLLVALLRLVRPEALVTLKSVLGK